MTSPIDPVATVAGHMAPDSQLQDHGERQRDERRQKKPSSSRAIVATAIPVRPAKPASTPPPPPAAFAAQVLGQPGGKRGLKGGAEVLDTARATYLSREYSGTKDRRPAPGVRKTTDI